MSSAAPPIGRSTAEKDMRKREAETHWMRVRSRARMDLGSTLTGTRRRLASALSQLTSQPHMLQHPGGRTPSKPKAQAEPQRAPERRSASGQQGQHRQGQQRGLAPWSRPGASGKQAQPPPVPDVLQQPASRAGRVPAAAAVPPATATAVPSAGWPASRALRWPLSRRRAPSEPATAAVLGAAAAGAGAGTGAAGRAAALGLARETGAAVALEVPAPAAVISTPLPGAEAAAAGAFLGMAVARPASRWATTEVSTAAGGTAARGRGASATGGMVGGLAASSSLKRRSRLATCEGRPPAAADGAGRSTRASSSESEPKPSQSIWPWRWARRVRGAAATSAPSAAPSVSAAAATAAASASSEIAPM
mmetsp:Transcript_2653/g.10526  ORF Transcript_2653/g.10526 Transcript_2653/m.10526 type:complete len:364 (+) Transcript_2653:1567-2658(+)